jgi:uncharacterized protein YdhG (YjbR/CyaY superfamily)
MTNAKSSTTVDAYLQSFPDDVRTVLENVRQAILRAAPDAVETSSYGMPTYDLNGKHLVFFAGWKRHISLYPIPAGDEAFQRDVAPYRTAKSTLRFPLSRPVPYDLIERAVSFLRRESQ